MFSISRDFTFCYGHRLLNYDGKCRNLHGHNARVRVVLSGETLNSTGMVRDFSDLKRSVAGWIERNLDHRLILAHNDPLAERLAGQDTELFLTDENPTAERLAQLIYDFVLGEGFPVERVDFWETDKCRATYSR